VSVSVDLVAHPEKTDTSLVAAAIPAGGVPGRRNILANPGFEKCSIPGMPDYYTDFRTAKTGLGYRLGDKRGDPLVGIETDKPYEGRNCLRTSQGFFLFGSGVRNTAPTRFVFSAYVRGSKGGQVGFYGCADNKQFFPLTPEWQRISTTIQYPFKGEGDIFGFHVRGTNSVWIDAMQFEKGEAPTPYAP
jgi:hypothetical protein